MQAEKDPKRNHKKKTKTKTFWPAADFKMKTGPKFFRLHFLRRFSCKKEPQIVRNFFRLRRAENPMKCSGGGGGLSPRHNRLGANVNTRKKNSILNLIPTLKKKAKFFLCVFVVFILKKTSDLLTLV